MRITEPNYTQIPNIIFDYWMHVLSPTEFKVLLAICRKTFGWHKERDSLSITQLMTLTGIGSRATICKCLQKLEDSHLVIKIKSKTNLGCDASNKYEIDVQIFEGGSSENELGIVQKMNDPVVQKMNTQKKPITKEKEEERKGEPKVFFIKRREGINACPSKDGTFKETLVHVETSERDHQKLIDSYGEKIVDRLYDELIAWKESAAIKDVQKYSSDYRRLAGWVARKIKKDDAELALADAKMKEAEQRKERTEKFKNSSARESKDRGSQDGKRLTKYDNLT